MLFPLAGVTERLAYPMPSDNRAAMSLVPQAEFVADAARPRFNLLTSPAKRANAAGISESADTSAPMQMRASPLAR
ncbi:MAG: hypothetical protein A3E77_17010 [Sphingopyxis sp. RIFCSPHIGHO2_12_FULL_65_19]|nr:MAG: hypothetical protein A3E77_17010 [Sphingopyxis sp. RIFCSPHIGHO2_12_FULL_65_19]